MFAATGKAASVFVLGAISLFLLAGCEQSIGEPAQLGGQSRMLKAATQPDRVQAAVAVAYDAAKAELTGPFNLFIRDSSESTGTIRFEPQYLSRGASLATGEFRILSTPSDLRRTVAVRISSDGVGVWAEVRVDLETRVTQQMQAYQSLRTAKEAPTDTPVAEEGRLSPDRRDAWRSNGRQYDLENEILTAIRARLSGQPRPSSTTRPG